MGASKLPVAIIVQHWVDLLSCAQREDTRMTPVFTGDYIDAQLDAMFVKASADPTWELTGATVVYIADEDDRLPTLHWVHRLNHRMLPWTNPDRWAALGDDHTDWAHFVPNPHN
tara:strand:- start:438 stop:779 length:342 start_codon:yes stop_codon:yes gene_type:complete